MKTKKTFVFNLEWAEALDGFGPDVECAVYYAIVHYGRTGEVLELDDPAVRVAFDSSAATSTASKEPEKPANPSRNPLRLRNLSRKKHPNRHPKFTQPLPRYPRELQPTPSSLENLTPALIKPQKPPPPKK